MRPYALSKVVLRKKQHNTILEQSRTIEELNLELSRTKEKLETKDQELTSANKDLREKSNKIESLYGAIVYYKDVIAKYREANIFKRIFKYNVEKDLEKPQLVELEMDQLMARVSDGILYYIR